jgi:hypothetical protein
MIVSNVGRSSYRMCSWSLVPHQTHCILTFALICILTKVSNHEFIWELERAQNNAHEGCYGDAFELCYSENLHGDLSQDEISDITEQFETDSRAKRSSLPSTELDGLTLPQLTGDDDVDLCVIHHYQEKSVTTRCSLAIHELKLVTAYVERSTGVGIAGKELET